LQKYYYSKKQQYTLPDDTDIKKGEPTNMFSIQQIDVAFVEDKRFAICACSKPNARYPSIHQTNLYIFEVNEVVHKLELAHSMIVTDNNRHGSKTHNSKCQIWRIFGKNLYYYQHVKKDE